MKRKTGTISFQEAQRRREVAKAEQEELKTAKLRGQLLDADLIQQGLNNVCISFRTYLMKLAPTIGREIDEPEIRIRVMEIVNRRVREALEILSNYDVRKKNG
jgi:hypothetical protein